MSINRTLDNPHVQPHADTNTVGGKKQMSPDDFITLFTTQLMHQNPLHPADSSVLLQQMADIQSISASNDMKETLKTIEKKVSFSLGNSQFMAATQSIGKHVQVASSISSLTKEDGMGGSVLVPGQASKVTVDIKDQSGKLVKTLDLGPATNSGLMDFKWDGVGDDNNPCQPGYYTISAKANINGTDTQVKTAGSFKIKSVALNPQTNGVVFNVDGLGGIGLDDIVKIV